MLATSTEVQRAFALKYGGQHGRISRRSFDGRLALLTTTSALGRSSLYNRLSYGGRRVYERVGSTSGSGEFHFSNGLYADLSAYAQEYCVPSAKHTAWGNGWRNRREVVRRVLGDLGLSQDLLYHGVEREVFVAPMAGNAREFLRGEQERLEPGGASAQELFEHFRSRWLLPRAQRTGSCRDHPFADLPAALVEDVLRETTAVADALLGDFQTMQQDRPRLRRDLATAGMLMREPELPFPELPTTCGLDG